MLGLVVLGANATFVFVCGVRFAQSFGKRNRVSERLKSGIAASFRFFIGGGRGEGDGHMQAGHAGGSRSSGVKCLELVVNPLVQADTEREKDSREGDHLSKSCNS